ncbi:hypothetical protein CB0940_05073 [Cercospora beticola]|uniref:Uncharacterized protein n=1 Tax=Cercospora beticola TaxID=122368 RepID=A0A2G5HN29_CERBT|nr:hypothetical protein CB0940_05073 [Cercospora beticola]PIA93653.1 hypothetical protein CB0940_05073 [Cercospora beticola]WPB02373.1 hypothetical protein RHO25_007007 [Cercospora beticola]
MSLPDCSSFENPCQTCFLGASTEILTYPYNITQTVDVTTFTYVTGQADGSNSTRFEIITADFETGSGAQTVLEENATSTWVPVDGVTLTFPTTYASFVSFSGTAAPNASPSACASSTTFDEITFPATTAPASFIYAPAVGTDAFTELTEGQLPTAVLAYLGELDAVVSQLGGNEPSVCAPTTPITLTSAVSCLTTSTISICVPVTSDGTVTSSCSPSVTSFPTELPPTEVTTNEPPPNIKTGAAALRGNNGPRDFIPYSPPGGGSPNPTPDPQLPENPTPNTGGNNNGGNNNGGNNNGGGTNNGGNNSGGGNTGGNNGGTNNGGTNSGGDTPSGNNSPAQPETPGQPSAPTDGTSGSGGESGQGGQENPATGGQSANPQDGTSQSGQNPVSAPEDDTPSSADSASAPQDGSSGSSSSSSSSSPADPGSGSEDSTPQLGQDGSSDAVPAPEDGSTSSESEQTPSSDDSSGNDTTSPSSSTSDDSSSGDNQSGSSSSAAAADEDDSTDSSSPSSPSASSDDNPSDPELTGAPSSGSTPSSDDDTSGSGTTGAGDYIMSGLNPGPSRTLTSVGSAGTSVSVEPYTGSAIGRASASLMACVLGFVGMGFTFAGL